MTNDKPAREFDDARFESWQKFHNDRYQALKLENEEKTAEIERRKQHSCGDHSLYPLEQCEVCKEELYYATLKAENAELRARNEKLSIECSGMGKVLSKNICISYDEHTKFMNLQSEVARLRESSTKATELILKYIEDNGMCECGFEEEMGEGYTDGTCFLHEACEALNHKPKREKE